MIDGSEPRKTSSNDKEQSNNLRQRLSFCSFCAFCSFYEWPDDVSWAWDESLWPDPVLFHAVVAVEQGAPTGAKGWAEPLAPAPTSHPWRGVPLAHRTPPPRGKAAPTRCEARRRRR